MVLLTDIMFVAIIQYRNKFPQTEDSMLKEICRDKHCHFCLRRHKCVLLRAAACYSIITCSIWYRPEHKGNW